MSYSYLAHRIPLPIDQRIGSGDAQILADVYAHLMTEFSRRLKTVTPEEPFTEILHLSVQVDRMLGRHGYDTDGQIAPGDW